MERQGSDPSKGSEERFSRPAPSPPSEPSGGEQRVEPSPRAASGGCAATAKGSNTLSPPTVPLASGASNAAQREALSDVADTHKGEGDAGDKVQEVLTSKEQEELPSLPPQSQIVHANETPVPAQPSVSLPQANETDVAGRANEPVDIEEGLTPNGDTGDVVEPTNQSDLLELPYFPAANVDTWKRCSWKRTCMMQWYKLDPRTKVPVQDSCFVEVLCFTPAGAQRDPTWRPKEVIDTPLSYTIAELDTFWSVPAGMKGRWTGQVLIVMPPMPFGDHPKQGNDMLAMDEVLQQNHESFKQVVDMLSDRASVFVTPMENVSCLDVRTGARVSDSEMHILPPCHFAFSNLRGAVPGEVLHSLGEKNLLLFGFCIPPDAAGVEEQ